MFDFSAKMNGLSRKESQKLKQNKLPVLSFSPETDMKQFAVHIQEFCWYNNVNVNYEIWTQITPVFVISSTKQCGFHVTPETISLIGSIDSTRNEVNQRKWLLAFVWHNFHSIRSFVMQNESSRRLQYNH